MRHILLPLSNGLMNRSGLEPLFLRVDFCFKVRFGLVTGGGGLKRMFSVFLRNSIRLWSLVQGVSKWRACGL